MPRALSFVGAASLALGLGAGAGAATPGAVAPDSGGASRPATIGRPIAAITGIVLHDRRGGRVTLGTRVLRGKPTLISVWAAWCPPCRAEAPMLNQLRHGFGPSYNFVYINRRAGNPDPDQPQTSVDGFLARGGLSDVDYLVADVPTYQKIIGADAGAIPAGKVGIPRVYLFDRRGREIFTHYGFDDGDGQKLHDLLARAIAAPVRAR